MIILDLGNGDMHHNDKGCIKETIDSILDINRKRDIIIKFQLFQAIGDKTPMRWDAFDWAYEYATSLKFQVTASVFDYDSYDFLINYDIPFVKYSNQNYVKRIFNPGQFDIVSVDNENEFMDYADICEIMCCVSKYPAKIEDYENTFAPLCLKTGISDHTGTIELYAKYEPKIYEAHYALEKWDDRNREYCLRSKDLIELMSIRMEK